MLPYSIPIQVFFVLMAVGYIIVGGIVAFYSSEKFKDHMIENFVPPMWQNFVFVMLILLWPVFVFLVACATILILFKEVK